MERGQWIQDLNDPSPRRRARAARRLGGIREPEVVTALADALGDPEPIVRCVAAQSLGRTGEAAAATALAAATSDPEERVRRVARQMLGHLLLKGVAVDEMQRLGEPAVAGLLEVLATGDVGTYDPEAPTWGFQARDAAAAALGQMGELAAVMICRALEGGCLHVRGELTRALLSIGRPSVPPLCAMLKTPDPVVRMIAVENLRRLRDPSAVPALCERLQSDNDSDVRDQVAATLAEIGSRDAVPSLCRALEDRNGRVRISAAAALAAIPDANAVGPLCESLEDGIEELRAEARRALVAIGAPAVASLCESLATGSAVVREAAATALGEIGEAGAATALCRGAQDRDAVVRRKAGQALLRVVAHADAVEPLVAMGAPAVPPLCEVLRAGGAMARCHAATALGRIAERDPSPSLQAAVPLLRHLVASRRTGDLPGEEAAYASALERIEAAVAAMRLPVPSAAPPPSLSELPLPSSAPLRLDELPLPAAAPPLQSDALPLPAAAPATSPVDLPHDG